MKFNSSFNVLDYLHIYEGKLDINFDKLWEIKNFTLKSNFFGMVFMWKGPLAQDVPKFEVFLSVHFLPN